MGIKQEYSVRDRIAEREFEEWFPYILLSPIIVYLITVVWYPYLQGFAMSFYEWPLFGEKTFIGLGNYEYLLKWEIFWKSVGVTILYGTQTFGHVVLGTAMALIVWHQERFKSVTSVIFLSPYLVPPLISGTFFRYFLHPDVGPFFKYLNNLFGIEPVYWMTYGDYALPVVTLIGVWTWSPFVFLLVLAALEGIPQSYYETSYIYGTGLWQRFRYITLPQIKSTLLLAIIIRIIWNLGKVSQPFQITRGGPGYDTSILGILLYRLAWADQTFGLAYAVGVILGLISLAFVSIFIWRFEAEEVNL